MFIHILIYVYIYEQTAIESLGFVPQRLLFDLGTENILVGECQKLPGGEAVPLKSSKLNQKATKLIHVHLF